METLKRPMSNKSTSYQRRQNDCAKAFHASKNNDKLKICSTLDFAGFRNHKFLRFRFIKMPPKKTSSIVPVNPRFLDLPCEWQECQFVTNEMEKFIKHLSEHLTTLLSSVTPPEQVLGCFNCKWRNCDVAVIGHISDYTRHVFFHAFHTKIKCIGSMLVKNLELHACTLDGQSCNLIPDLPECLQCGWTHCGAVYDNPEFFYRHVDFHADSFPNGNNLKGGCACQWEGCDVNVKSKHKLREHLRSHTQQKLVACPNCGGLFSSRTKFFDHLERQKDVQCYQCSYCNKKFQTERLMRDHVRIHVNCYKCPLCDMTCPNPHGLRNHLRYKHTSERQYNCLECDYRSKTPSDLRRHMETHSENTIMCHVKGCCFVTRLYQCLASHYQKTHQGIDTHRFACHICEAFFTRGSLLTKHLKKTHKYKLPSGYSRFRLVHWRKCLYPRKDHMLSFSLSTQNPFLTHFRSMMGFHYMVKF
ncbi:histone H4 transcription factor-like [Octopus vulgaris]|uniref:Histone H4 transcription factor-like n=1 Tax=Octopus vulgaris TaxID=6645 RepID=A0AA36F3P4_OCTVU|nr:histone H4 transcription factor-like [Octopus vulgaris]